MISDPILEFHLRGAEAYINTGLRPGTRSNHLTALRLYIDFTSQHRLIYMRPSVSSLCAFIHSLTLKYPNPTTIINYVAALASALKRLGVDVAPFRSVNVYDFLSSIKVNIRHEPTKRLPVSYDMLCKIVQLLINDPQGPTLVFAVLLMYFSFLRQSNLCPRNKTAFDPTRHLLRTDVIARHDALLVAVKWSKTRQGSHASSVAMPALPGALTCPLMAWRAMLQHAPTIKHPQPLFSFRDATPLPLSYMKRVWDQTLIQLGITHRLYTLHSLRRGGATDVYQSGTASIQEIQSHGDWRSDAVFTYLPHDPRHSRIPDIFRDIAA